LDAFGNLGAWKLLEETGKAERSTLVLGNQGPTDRVAQSRELDDWQNDV